MRRLLLQHGRRASPCVSLHGHAAKALLSSGVLTRSMAPRPEAADRASSRSKNMPVALMQKVRLSASPAFSAEPDALQPEIVSFKLTGEPML
jgi:hypothetical protein